MKIYIAYDVEDKPISILLAENGKLANVAWAGMKDIPTRVEVIDPNDPKIEAYGVAFLLTSIVRNTNDYSHRIGGIEFREWIRGL